MLVEAFRLTALLVWFRSKRFRYRHICPSIGARRTPDSRLRSTQELPNIQEVRSSARRRKKVELIQLKERILPFKVAYRILLATSTYLERRKAVNLHVFSCERSSVLRVKKAEQACHSILPGPFAEHL